MAEIENFKNSLKKLNRCDQLWNEMKPNNGGRLCGKCDKIIIDFSKMSFTEIAFKMSESNQATCGFYLPEQIDHIKKSGSNLPLSIGLTTLIASTSLANSEKKQTEISLSNHDFGKKNINELNSIQNEIVKDSILLSGRVEYYDSISKKKLTDSYAYIVIKGTKNGVLANEDGSFRMKYLPNLENEKLILSIGGIGFNKKEIEIKIENNNDIDLGVIVLEKAAEELTAFWVTSKRRSFIGRLWQKATAPLR
jgi:carboxypeptidase-like protein